MPPPFSELRMSRTAFLFVILINFDLIESYHVHHRNYSNHSTRVIIPAPAAPIPPGADYDVILVDNYLRNYITGPINDYFVLMTHDMISTYVGPPPKGHAVIIRGKATGRIRAWAMFDAKSRYVCQLNAIHNWGMLALFSCPHSGVYQAYAYESNLVDVPMLYPEIHESGHQEPTLEWLTKPQKEQFDLMLGPGTGPHHIALYTNEPKNIEERIALVHKAADVVRSDPVVVKGSHYCYIWMYSLTETARLGYVNNDEVVPHVIDQEEGAYIEYELLIWVAEPSAVLARETGGFYTDPDRKPIISDYSQLITQRFSDIGIFPCLRKAHSVIEIRSAMEFVEPYKQRRNLDRAPYWRTIIRIHTDRLISTLSDVSFTIASRQYTASMHCFIAETRVFISVRNFKFVRKDRLARADNVINLEFSNIFPQTKVLIRHQIKHIYGHGVHFIGNKKTKMFQPFSSRTDMAVFTNPCISQEFAVAVAGSLYIAEGFLEKGMAQLTRVILPGFKNPDGYVVNPDEYREYLRILDVAFTPTHVAFINSYGFMFLHSTSAALKGIALIESTTKYRPTAFVRKRWCSRTSTPKYSAMKLPIFSRDGNLVVFQVYSIEGNIRLWITAPTESCSLEGAGFFKKSKSRDEIVKEDEIHKEESKLVDRTDPVTGKKLKEEEDKNKNVDNGDDDDDDDDDEAYLDLYEGDDKNLHLNQDLDDELFFLLSDEDNLHGSDGHDPHFPPELLDPAAHVIGHDYINYNDGVIYVLEKEMQTTVKVLTANGLTKSVGTELGLYTVEEAAVEDEFILAINLVATEIPKSFAAPSFGYPFQMVLTSLKVTNYPYRQKIDRDHLLPDESLNIIIPFPGTVLIRSKPFMVDVIKSRDPIEQEEHSSELKGKLQQEFAPEIFTLNTAIPSYVINFGDILVYSSLEGRYARPLHYFTWDTINKNAEDNFGKNHPEPLHFNQSFLNFRKMNVSHDPLVSEQGVISILWRKKQRHLLMDDYDCLHTEDGDTQTVAMGSVISLEGLREVKPFFRNDNIFQTLTPDGEIVYGYYTMQPHSPFPSCKTSVYEDTKNDSEACVQQAKSKPPTNPNLPDVCTVNVTSPCLDPAYISNCPLPLSSQTLRDTEPCLRLNSLNCSGTRYPEEFYRPRPLANAGNKCVPFLETVTNCFPKHAPREELRSANILGTPFLSYLLGSLSAVSSVHPEAENITSLDPTHVKEHLLHDELPKETTDFCPFSSFFVYNKDFDFAEVGYRTRITGEISYYGNNIPTEADLKIEFERMMGVVVDVTGSVEEERGLTTIRKTIDINFEMTDYTYRELVNGSSQAQQNVLFQHQLDIDDLRALEKSAVFSITLRPTVVNMKCKKNDFFKTIQFNVGCNAFSTMQLISQATALLPIKWEEMLGGKSKYKWIRDLENWKLKIPSDHIFFQQVNNNSLLNCSKENDGYCDIPYFHLFEDKHIYTIPYRDLFHPKFEQFMTVSSRRVKGNIVLYDMLGSDDFTYTLNKLKAGCFGNGKKWYQTLLGTTANVGRSISEHEDVYLYYKDCFDSEIHDGQRSLPNTLFSAHYHMHNLTNNNKIKFRRKRNQIFIFRAVVVNTEYNRFTYCKLLDTYFLVRVVGIPIPRQELTVWLYLAIFSIVCFGFLISYWVFYKFYTWKLDLGVMKEDMDQGIEIEIVDSRRKSRVTMTSKSSEPSATRRKSTSAASARTR